MNLQTRNKTNSEQDNAKKFTVKPNQLRTTDHINKNNYVEGFYFDKNAKQNNEYIQEPEDEEEHNVKPFEARSLTSSS